MVRIIILRVPWLGLGFINPILSLVVSKVLSIAIEQTVLGTAFLWIDGTRKNSADNFEKKKKVLDEYLGQKDVPDAELKKAEKDFDESFRDAVTIRRT